MASDRRKIVIESQFTKESSKALKGIDVADELDIPDHRISQDMERQATLYTWYAVLASKARVYRETVEAQLQLRIRKEHEDVKTTETYIEACVRTEPRWREAREFELYFSDLRQGFEIKGNMLQSLCKWLISEREQRIAVYKEKVNKILSRKV